MSAITKTTYHVRSISLPTRSHPLVSDVEDHLSRLRTTTSASSICQTFDNLKTLYESVNDMLQLPLTQQALSQEATEEVLNGSVRLLDLCGISKDVLLQITKSVQELESSLRRSRGAGSDLERDVKNYMISRTMATKMVSKCMRNLKSFKKSCPAPLLDQESNIVLHILQEVEAISLSTMKSLLCYLSETQAKSKKNSWSLVSRMMQPKHVSCKTKEEVGITELESLDSLLNTLKKPKPNSDNELVRCVKKQLETSEVALREIEAGLEPVFRSLLKTRVSLLNMFNH